MKALFRLGTIIGLACLGCSALHATSYLVTIQAENGQYVCAENGGGSSLSANRNYAGSWETFVIDELSAYVITIKSTENPKYLCAEGSHDLHSGTNHYHINNDYLVANRDYVGSWEQFNIVDPFYAGSPTPLSSGMIVPKLLTDKLSYVRADNGGGGSMDIKGGNYQYPGWIYEGDLRGWTGTRFTIIVLAVL